MASSQYNFSTLAPNVAAPLHGTYRRLKRKKPPRGITVSSQGDHNINIAFRRKSSESEPSLEQKFSRLAKQWRKETRHVSSIHEKSMNMAYQKIIGMGKEVLPYIFRDFQRTHDDWLWALQVITEAEPAPGQYDDFDEVVEAWLNWARENHYLA